MTPVFSWLKKPGYQVSRFFAEIESGYGSYKAGVSGTAVLQIRAMGTGTMVLKA